VTSVATPRPARPLYAVFLERVIQIEAVQCYRAAVTDDHTADFFELGRIPGVFGDFLWSLDALKAFPGGPIPREPPEEPVSLPMEHAWNAAVAAFAEFVAALVNGELIASGVYAATGARFDLDPTEWMRAGLILDVCNSDLIEMRHGKRTVRWSAIVVRAAIQQPKLGAIDWEAEWNEDVARREKGELPNKKGYLRELETRIQERYGVTSMDGGDLRRFRAALYRGDLVRPRKK
jgi:hypothetical protein